MRESNKSGIRFCFILGAGASVESGISSGNTLEMRWMNELMGREAGADGSEAERVAAETRKLAEALYEENRMEHEFSEIETAWKAARKAADVENKEQGLPSKFYFDLYKLRFYTNPRNGYHYLEQTMEGRNPSIGYYTLAKLLTDDNSKAKHPTDDNSNNLNNLVITTNFDSLVEDALFLYTAKKPLVVSHESLVDYISSDVQRPIVAKVHRGLMYEPFNSPEATHGLKPEWQKALNQLFNIYTPVVIGYAGGDQSLMTFLEADSTVLRNGIYWCYLDNPDSSPLPDERIQTLVEKKEGFLVGIRGFDALMLELGKAYLYGLGPSKIEEYLKDQINQRIALYNDQWEKLSRDPEMQDVIQSAKDEEQRTEEQREESGTLTAWDHIRRGDRARDIGNFDEAIAEYQKAAEKDPTLSAVHNNWGIAYANQERYEEAIQHYDQAIRLDLNNAKVYNNRGNAYKNMSLYNKALADYNRAIELDPNYATAYYNRGNTYDNMGQHDKAIADYSRAIELNPNYAIAYNNRGSTYDDMGQYDKAIEDYSKAIELDPNYAAAYNNRGVVYENKGQYDKAVEDYSKAIELNPQSKKAYRNRADAYRALGQEDLAEADEKMAETL